MTKVPFTPKGISDKFVELYEFGDQELILEARAISANFKIWVKDNFLLEPDQEKDLNNAPYSVLMYWSFLFGAALIGRHHVVMADLPEKLGQNPTFNLSLTASGSYTPERDAKPAETSFEGILQITVTEK